MNEEENIEIRMYIPEESSTRNYLVVKVADHLYKLANNDPFSEELIYGTIIEVQTEKKDDVFVFKKIYSKSAYTLDVISLPPLLYESEMRIIGNMIMEEGGYWEVIFGGMGYVNLPKKSNLNVIDELNKLIKIKQGKTD